jgi:hypothetical protein
MRASNKICFIRAVINGDLLLSNRKRLDIEADLDAQGFDKMAKSKDVSGFIWPCAQKLASASITVIYSAQANYLVKLSGRQGSLQMPSFNSLASLTTGQVVCLIATAVCHCAQ